ncbi:predicted protein [Coccidioides posadasii str. Silveira]|uniref:Predicted protein n=1 Tax=Coccidioides posadasii (strain RMSCC 757 / Silveira) TaxID=443226 RepID=E9D2Z5_COCPS|nr:predicted protein [Coccidioides posadasii str. Silveira]
MAGWRYDGPSIVQSTTSMREVDVDGSDGQPITHLAVSGLKIHVRAVPPAYQIPSSTVPCDGNTPVDADRYSTRSSSRMMANGLNPLCCLPIDQS